jgi:acyl-CoA thioesterase
MATKAQLPPVEAVNGWGRFLRDGEGYLKTAVNAHENRKEIFTPENLYNVTAMAIEKFVMAALMRHGAMPYNHTMADLVEAMEKTFPHTMDDIREGLLALDKYQQICAIDTYNISPLSMDEILDMLELAQKVRQLVVDRFLL